MNTFTTIILSMFLVLMLLGYHRGMIRSVLKTIFMALALFVAYLIAPLVSDIVCDKTKIDDYFEAKIYVKVEDKIGDEVNGIYSNFVDKIPGYQGSGELSSEQQAWLTDTVMMMELSDENQDYFIDQMDIPNSIKNQLKEDNNSDTKKDLGVDNFYKYISTYLARMIVNAMTFFALFVLLTIIANVIYFAVGIATSIPIVGGLNKAGGVLFGLLEALLITWGIFLIVAVSINTSFGQHIYAQIEESKILSALYDGNLFLPLISRH